MSDAPSPFRRRGEQWAWDSTSLKLIQECPRKYYYAMVEGWKARDSSVHLRFGGHYATALEHYEKARASGVNHEDALRQIVHEAMIATFGWESGHAQKNRFTLIRSIVWYLEEFGPRDNTTTRILADGTPAVELSFQFEYIDEITFCGHFDRIVDFNGDPYVMDQKTTMTTLTPRWFEQFTPDTQMSMYALAAQIVFDTPVKGVIIDAAQIAAGFTRFQRGFAFRTDTMLGEFLACIYHYVMQAWTYARNEYWPMNTTACNNYGGCQFRSICSKSPEVRDKFLESNFSRIPWNPLEKR